MEISSDLIKTGWIETAKAVAASIPGGEDGFTPAANVAAAAVPFADLTAAANKVNEILTALKAAGLMSSS